MAVMDLMGKQTVNAQTIEGDDSFDVVIIGGAHRVIPLLEEFLPQSDSEQDSVSTTAPG